MTKIKRIALPGLLIAVAMPGAALAQERPSSFGVSAGLADLNQDSVNEAVQFQGLVGYDFWEHWTGASA